MRSTARARRSSFATTRRVGAAATNFQIVSGLDAELVHQRSRQPHTQAIAPPGNHHDASWISVPIRISCLRPAHRVPCAAERPAAARRPDARRPSGKPRRGSRQASSRRERVFRACLSSSWPRGGERRNCRARGRSLMPRITRGGRGWRGRPGRGERLRTGQQQRHDDGMLDVRLSQAAGPGCGFLLPEPGPASPEGRPR